MGSTLRRRKRYRAGIVAVAVAVGLRAGPIVMTLGRFAYTGVLIIVARDDRTVSGAKIVSVADAAAMCFASKSQVLC